MDEMFDNVVIFLKIKFTYLKKHVLQKCFHCNLLIGYLMSRLHKKHPLKFDCHLKGIMALTNYSYQWQIVLTCQRMASPQKVCCPTCDDSGFFYPRLGSKIPSFVNQYSVLFVCGENTCHYSPQQPILWSLVLTSDRKSPRCLSKLAWPNINSTCFKPNCPITYGLLAISPLHP